jgi:GntR family transcriptional repressor for pyruvate dehydrogenase complex
MKTAESEAALEELAAQLQPIRSPRTFEAAVDQIVGLIEGRRLGVGDRLPNLPRLAEALDISRPTAAQALRLLERSGVVKSVRGAAGGIYVTSDLVPMDVIASEVELAEEALVSLLEARRIFEGAASHLAALRAIETDFEAIDHTIELSERYQDDRAAAVRADGMFHRAIARAAHNHHLERVVSQILRDLMPLRDAWGSSERIRRQLAEADADVPVLQSTTVVDVHRRHLEAIKARVFELLATVLDEHLSWLERLYAAALGKKNAETAFEALPPRDLLGSVLGTKPKGG